MTANHVTGAKSAVYDYLVCKVFITGPPTHSVGGQTSNGRWRLLSSAVVCNSRLYICNVTHQGAKRDGEPVVLSPVRATPC